LLATSWQAGLLALVVLGICRLARRAAPRFRYALWCLVLLKLCLPPGLTLCTGVGYWVALGGPPQRGRGDTGAQQTTQTVDLVEPAQAELPARILEPLVAAEPPVPVPQPFPWRGTALAVWLAGALAMGGLVTASYGRMRRRVRRGMPVADPAALAALREAQQALGVRASVRLVAVDGLRSPLLSGLFRPQVALPTQTLAALSVTEVRPVLLHELAHLRRRDLWVNWLQVVLQAAYWFHPLVWLANLRLRAERELIVDDLVLAHLDGQREVYSDSLLHILQNATGREWLAPAYVGIAEPQSRIVLRLKRILDPDRPLSPCLGWPARVAVAALALLLIPQSRPAEKPAAKQAGTPPIAESATATVEPAEPVAPARAVAEQSQKAAVAIPPELARLWQRLDDLAQAQKDLAWQHWEALSSNEKVDLISRTAAQPPPAPQARAPLSEEIARGILATYTQDGADGRSRLQDVAMNLIGWEEGQAYAQQRQAIAHEIAALGPGVVPALLDEIVRGGTHTWEAQQALGALGTQASPALLNAIADTREDWPRCSLYTALAGARDPAAREALTAALGDPFPHTRDAALRGLERLGPVPQEVYLRCLEDDYHSLRAYAVTRLGEVGDAQAVPALLEVARYDPSSGKGGVLYLRRNAREAIEKIGQRTGAAVPLPPPGPGGLERRQPLSFEELAECARSSSPMVRRLVITHLGTGDYRELRTVTLLATLFEEDPVQAVREAALGTLGEMARRLDLPEAERGRLFGLAMDAIASVRVGRTAGTLWAAYSLAGTSLPQQPRFAEFCELVAQCIEGTDRVLQIAGANLLSVLANQHPDAFEGSATAALRERLLPHLLRGLDDPQTGYRIRFIELLGHLRERSVVPRLIGFVAGDDLTAAQFAAEALGRIGDHEAVPVLIEAIRRHGDRHDPVQGRFRRSAYGALARIGDERAQGVLAEAAKDDSVGTGQAWTAPARDKAPVSTAPTLLVTGTVTDAATGAPIAGARVTDDGYGYAPYGYLGATTAAQGHYGYKTWPEEHNVSAVALGYAKASKLLATGLLQTGRERVLDFALTRQ